MAGCASLSRPTSFMGRGRPEEGDEPPFLYTRTGGFPPGQGCGPNRLLLWLPCWPIWVINETETEHEKGKPCGDTEKEHTQ